MESLMAALQAGADAVYFGVEHLNMRSRSSNRFVLDDLPAIIENCRAHNARAYLTLNAVLYDQDLNLMRNICDRAKEAGVDAIIASDQAAMGYCHRIGMPVHISTQVNVSNIESVRFYSMFSDVMVLARELSLKQVAEIATQIEKQDIRGPSGNLVRLEVFVHGALCMAISGKCYLSLHAHNASANRGACFQNCRRKYHVKDAENGDEWMIEDEYIMSPKDLCTIDFLDKVLDSGVKVLKIEGRGRAPDYVHTVTRCYREAVEAYFDGTYDQEKVATWKEQLAEVYNRGFWDGYYLGRKLGEWTKDPNSQATQKKVYIGKGVRYFDRIGVAEFKLESYDLKPGDEILITGKKTGVVESVVQELRVDGKPADSAKRGDSITIPLGRKIHSADKLYKLVKTAE